MNKPFRRVLAAEVISNFGSMLSRLAIPWLATIALGATPFEMGLLVVADVVAGAVGSLFLGAMVDRSGKRAVMLATDFARAGVLGLLAGLAFAQALALWMLVAAAAASGLLTVMFELARSAWVAQRVAAADLPVRNAQMAAGTSLSETAAFALGGWLYQWLGAVMALAIDAASYIVSAICLRGVAETPVEAAPNGTPRERLRALLEDAREGIAAVRSSPTLRALAGIEVLLCLSMSITGACYMVFVARDIGFETGTLGMIFATGGIGSLLGAVLAARIGRRVGSKGAMCIGLATMALGALCIPLAPGATLFGAALLITHQVVGDGGHAVHDVYDRTLRQSAAPELLARVDAGIRTLGLLAQLAGAIGGGTLATHFGTRPALALAAALIAVAAAYALKRLPAVPS